MDDFQIWLISVRNILIDMEGDHMVASTKLAKRLSYLFKVYACSFNPVDAARLVSDTTEFAGSGDYEGYFESDD
jgi:hypothetical protein